MRNGIAPLLALLYGAFLLPLTAQEQDPAADLAKVAERFVASYNEKNLANILALYTTDAEMIDEIDGLSASGIDAIQSIFESSFTKYPDRRIALEVIDVRQVADNVVIEEGITRFSGEVPNEEGDAIAYSAVLVKHPEKGWLIASSREIASTSAIVDPLEGLYPLEGDWILQADQMQMELSLALSDSGRFLVGSAVTSTPDAGAMQTEIRIGYDPSMDQIRWWTFDEMGGFGQGAWQAIENGWLVRSNGVTADGEITTAIQRLVFEDGDTIVWDSTDRFLDGAAQPDLQLRLVRRPPAPSFSFVGPDESGEPAATEPAPAETPSEAPAATPETSSPSSTNAPKP
jgi:uncharacterized protein (TIGR02246 family)